MQLDLKNVSPIQSRVEAHQPEQGYDGVISRAFASLNDMLSWCKHLPAVNGQFFAMKGAAVQEEIAALPDFVKVMAIKALQVPELDAQRHLVILAKV
ncbi:16S rRNA (guanine(527)-N(7))-methyltransferase RsmG [Alishewanella longhuensis]